MKQHGSKYFAPRGQKIKIQLFQNNFILHINLKGIRKCSNMYANILPTDPPSPLTTLGEGGCQKVKILLFQNIMVMQIKLNAITKCSCMQGRCRRSGRSGKRRTTFLAEYAFRHVPFSCLGPCYFVLTSDFI